MPLKRRPLALPGGLLALALALTVTLVVLGPAPGRGADEDAAAIRRLLGAQVEAWNRKDLDGFLDGYWQSPDVVFQSGADRFDGFEALRSRYRKSYQAEGRAMGQLAFTGLEVVLLGPDAALVRGRFQLTMPDGKRPSGLFTLILRKRPEGWRIVHDHTSS
jgi:beta-aspartyl-peptidase (threonine type)